MNRLRVWLDQDSVGFLEQDKSGRMSFTYAEGAKRAISLSMPLRESPYGHDACEAYFGGLLPESEQARKLIGKRFGVNGNNSFSLLRVIGHECAGAVTLFDDNEDSPPPAELKMDARALSEHELAQHIRELPHRPLLAGVEGIRLSLAGAADKAAVCVVDGEVALPLNDAPTTHILKPNISAVGDTVANEFFCMRLAARMGLIAAPVEMRAAEDVPFLLVERYDRRVANATLRRIHQEDFCQALSVVSARKYQNEGGPGYKDCFDLLKRVSRPAVDRNRLASVIIFNFLIGNMDAHGKNFSVVHDEALSLSPLYDVLATRIYPSLSDRLAMKVDKYYDADDIFPRHWQRLCESAGIAYPQFRSTFIQMSRKIVGAAEAERDAQRDSPGTDTFNRILDYLNKSTSLTLTRFEKEPAAPKK